MDILKPLDQAIEFYIANVSSKKTESTFKQEQKTLRDFLVLLRSVKGLPVPEKVDEVSPLHLEGVQTLVKTHEGKDLQNSTINRKFNTIRHFFQKLEDWNVLEVSPCRKVKDLPEDYNVRRPWTDSQFLMVYAQGEKWIQDILFFVKFTGARASSVSLLEWKDVDFKNEVIKLSHRKGKDKSLKLYDVPMIPEVFAMLKKRQRMGAYGANTPVFLTSKGKRPSPTHISRETRRLVEKAGLSFLKIGIHGLRHSVATALHNSGASTETIRRMLGHSNTKTTERYLHSNTADLMDAMNRAFRPAKTGSD
jgi:integrase/recombinase XerC